MSQTLPYVIYIWPNLETSDLLKSQNGRFLYKRLCFACFFVNILRLYDDFVGWGRPHPTKSSYNLSMFTKKQAKHSRLYRKRPFWLFNRSLVSRFGHMYITYGRVCDINLCAQTHLLTCLYTYLLDCLSTSAVSNSLRAIGFLPRCPK